MIPLEQWCQWEDSAGTMVSVENAIVGKYYVNILSLLALPPTNDLTSNFHSLFLFKNSHWPFDLD